MDWFSDGLAWLQDALFETLVQPLAFAVGLGGILEQAFDATGWFLVGLIQLLIMLLVLGPLERWRPVEPVREPLAVRTDVIYTLIHRLGLFRLAMFFLLDPPMQSVLGWLRGQGLGTWHLDGLWPGVTDGPWVSFVLYLVVFDALSYVLHRAQHQWSWWWALHAVHHSQRQMTMWTDNRNHLLDDIIQSVIWVVVAQAIGMGPGQFVALIAFTQLSESFQHANFRCSFGHWGERLWISPRFHRLHHAMGLGHETSPGVLGGHNFGVLLPWWDMLLGTARFDAQVGPTGIRDQIEQGRDYGQGWWSQQRLGLQRWWQALRG
jgi:sterol desaturase/sphingolipid hydroxylase (fatty acid hydroxylase superfamily)